MQISDSQDIYVFLKGVTTHRLRTFATEKHNRQVCRYLCRIIVTLPQCEKKWTRTFCCLKGPGIYPALWVAVIYYFHSSSTHSTCAPAGTGCVICHRDRNLMQRTSLRRSPGLTTDSLDHAGKANLGELPFSLWSKALTSIYSAFQLHRIRERSSGLVTRLKTICCQRLFMQRSRLSWKEYIQKEGQLE